MTSKVEKSIEVEALLQRVYIQRTQFEQFPQFMAGVEQVKQLSDTTLHWIAKIAGVKREWDAAILEQVPDRKVAWAASTGKRSGAGCGRAGTPPVRDVGGGLCGGLRWLRGVVAARGFR